MDQTHREFIDLLSAVADSADAGLLSAWADLVEHTDLHFAQEDHWMRQTRFASSNCHGTQHAVVLQVLREGHRLGGEGRLDVIRQIAHELVAWFPHHAHTMDAALAHHLHQVGFDPATGQMLHPERLPAAEIHGCGSVACTPSPATTPAETQTA
jgi:hemerythrin-like metal-binding protein